jgi:hypothetical protein
LLTSPQILVCSMYCFFQGQLKESSDSAHSLLFKITTCCLNNSC